MSTDFNGEHCAVKDKMRLTERQANDYIKRLSRGGADYGKYRCSECGDWHVSTRKAQKMRRAPRGKWGKPGA